MYLRIFRSHTEEEPQSSWSLQLQLPLLHQRQLQRQLQRQMQLMQVLQQVLQELGVVQVPRVTAATEVPGQCWLLANTGSWRQARETRGATTLACNQSDKLTRL